MLPLALHFHHHHLHLYLHPHGPPVGYAGIALAAFVSWAGVPGAGEAALITGAVFASRHRLDIASVELVAYAGAVVGGIAGWLAGLRFGAALVGAPGPLYRLRRNGLRAGERFYERFGALAVFLTPSWVAGIHRVRPAKYVPANAAAALAWTLGIGLATYVGGPSVAELFGDLGLIGTAVVVVVAVAAALLAHRHRRAKRHRSP